MRALVTGGAGFIGSTLVERLLAEGDRVDVVDDLSTGSLANLADARREYPGQLGFHHLDIRAPELVELCVRRRPEVVFHLAAQSSVPISLVEPVRDAEVNLLGSIRLLEAAREAGADKVVYAASGGSLYGDVDPAKLPVSEQAKHRPSSPYAVSKATVIDYLGVYRELHGLEFTALALANVYGPRQRADGEAGVVAIFARHLAERTPCVVEGDGNQTRDFVFVDDVVDAFARAARRGSGLVVNVGRGVEVSINDLYAAMAALAGRKAAPRRRKARTGDLQRIALDPARARIHLDWKPWTSLEEGLARTLEAAGVIPAGRVRA